jgi:GNAT superfamily N-acetyltransferase
VDEITFHENPDDSERSRLAERLESYNREASGHQGGAELASFVKHDGELIGGLVGWVWGGTSFVDLLWVAEEHRGTGLGSRFLSTFEAEVRGRGAVQVVLTTASFQAPAFYRRHGYEVIAEIPEHPTGHTEFILRKRL